MGKLGSESGIETFLAFNWWLINDMKLCLDKLWFHPVNVSISGLSAIAPENITLFRKKKLNFYTGELDSVLSDYAS